MNNKYKIIRYLKNLNVEYVDVCLSEQDAKTGSLFDPINLYIYIDKKQMIGIAKTLGLSTKDVLLSFLLHEAGHAYDYHFDRIKCSNLLYNTNSDSKIQLEQRAWQSAMIITDILKLDINIFAFNACRRYSIKGYEQYYAMIDAKKNIGVA